MNLLTALRDGPAALYKYVRNFFNFFLLPSESVPEKLSSSPIPTTSQPMSPGAETGGKEGSSPMSKSIVFIVLLVLSQLSFAPTQSITGRLFLRLV
jgi:hypothetical protein